MPAPCPWPRGTLIARQGTLLSRGEALYSKHDDIVNDPSGSRALDPFGFSRR